MTAISAARSDRAENARSGTAEARAARGDAPARPILDRLPPEVAAAEAAQMPRERGVAATSRARLNATLKRRPEGAPDLPASESPIMRTFRKARDRAGARRLRACPARALLGPAG